MSCRSAPRRIPVSSKKAGHHRSGFERNVRADLDRRGVSYEYESATIPWVEEHNYTPDIVLPNGIHIELKGYLDRDSRRLILAVRKQHPEIDLRLVFMNADTKISKKPSSQTYGQWATRHDVPYENGFIPDEWIEEEPQ